MEAMGPALPLGFGSRYEPTDSSNPRRHTGKRERAVGKTVILVTAKQQTGNALHTHATEHGVCVCVCIPCLADRCVMIWSTCLPGSTTTTWVLSWSLRL